MKVSEKMEWRFCPGSLNPADLPSRGSCGKDLSSNTLWLEGPEFLKQSCELWPNKGTVEQETDEIASQEEVKSPPNETHTLANASQSVGKFIDLERLGSKQMLLRTLAWVLRFIGNCGLSRNNGTPNLNGELSSIELENAELKLISLIQRETFAEEYQFLSGKKVERPSLRVSQFNLYLDKQGIIRTKSRITNASLADAAKTPMLLHAKHVYSELLIREYHATVLHSGIRDTLNEIRQRYWILRGREAVKRIIRSCVVCKWADGQTIRPLVAPDLPESRVDDAPPFTNIGLDFAGPLLVSEKGSHNKSSKKTYICLYTCLNTRAVHLELVDNLSVDAFLRSFRRFSARRGLPKKIYSDNAKAFKSASKEIKQILSSGRVKRAMVNKAIDWEFLVPKSPWMGGT